MAKTKRGGQPHAWYLALARLGIGTEVAILPCEGAAVDVDGAAASPNHDLTDDNDKEAEARQ